MPLTAHCKLRICPMTMLSKDITFLTTCGIKVRDFAYESTLPPVTIVPRFAVQTQPRPRTLKRTRDVLEGYDDGEESDVEDPSIYRTCSRYRKKTQALARTLTEPADDVPPSQGFNTREGGLTILPSQRPTSPVPPSQPAQCPTTPHRPNRHAQATSLSPLTIVDNVSPSQASGQGESQETDPWIDTPLVTPNGSLQWPIVQDTSTMPASQLKSILPQLPADDDVTFSQLGFSPERSQPQHRTPSRRRVHDPQLPPPAAFRCRTPSPAKSRHASGSPRRSPRSDGAEARQGPPEPRYHLRQRPPGGLNANTTNAGRGAPSASRRATSSSRSASQSARKMENAVPPVRKKQKPSPPADTPGRTTGNGRRKNADVEGIR
ncbi:hypothetical protein BD414DRAFT_511461 [Trametes punicea]|nr:hypothetical protein BD414DRAFT_511461 [Trametes punicea]